MNESVPVRIELKNLKPSTGSLNGATIGEAHAAQIGAYIYRRDSEIVIFDFKGITGATPSYLKQVIAPFIDGDRGMIPSPVLINVGSSDLTEDLETFLLSRSKVLIHADQTKRGLKFRRLLGKLDRAASETFKELCELKETTAAGLFERHSGETANQTAWNNRLTQLVELRIAVRRKQGRFWIYEPTVN